MFLIALVALKFVTGRYPWQISEESGLGQVFDQTGIPDMAHGGGQDYEF